MRITTPAVLLLGVGLVLAGCAPEQTPPLATLPTAAPSTATAASTATSTPITLAPTPTAACVAGCAPNGGPGITATPAPVDEAGWVTTLPPRFAPVMPAATAELAVQVQPALSGIHLSTSPPAYWSLAECDWLSDTMYADIQLDSGAVNSNFSAWNVPLGFWYANVVDEWQFLEGIATQACWRGGVITGEQAATAITDAMGNGWNGHVAHYATDAPGSFDARWDLQWGSAYMEIASLFAQVPQAPWYYCKLVWGESDAGCSAATAATVLASLGVSP
ncbi:MAG: hypothetical protein ACYDCS_09105 [Candidatus Dormibacteria bacterium]